MWNMDLCSSVALLSSSWNSVESFNNFGSQCAKHIFHEWDKVKFETNFFSSAFFLTQNQQVLYGNICEIVQNGTLCLEWEVVKSNILGGLCLASTCIGLFEHKSYVMSISPNTIPMLSLSTISIRRALSHEDSHLSLLFIHFLLQLLSDFCFWFRFHEISFLIWQKSILSTTQY